MGRTIIAAGLLILAVASLIFTAAEPRSPDYLFGQWRLRHVGLAGLLGLMAVAVLALGRKVTSPLVWASVLPAVLFLGVIEGAGRLGLVDWSALLDGKTDAGAEAPGWALTPDLSVTGETYQDTATMLGLAHAPIPFSFETDEYGFRNAPGTKADIILLGDSIVLGAQVPRDQTVAGILEREAGQPVMQAALLGISMQEQQDMLRASGLSLKDKLVVQFMFEGNDLLDSRSYRETPDGETPPETGASLIKLIWERLIKLTNPRTPYMSCDIDGDTYTFLWTRKSFAGVEGEFDPISQSILAFQAELEAEGARYALVFAPTKYRVLGDRCRFPEQSLIAERDENLTPLRAQTEAWASEAGIAYLDLTEPLRAAATAPWFWGDTHWNTEGHAVAGRAIAEWLNR